MQNRPICWECVTKIETNADMVFEAPCGHDDCVSVVFHGLCLMTWREKRDQIIKWVRERWEGTHGNPN